MQRVVPRFLARVPPNISADKEKSTVLRVSLRVRRMLRSAVLTSWRTSTYITLSVAIEVQVMVLAALCFLVVAYFGFTDFKGVVMKVVLFVGGAARVLGGGCAQRTD